MTLQSQLNAKLTAAFESLDLEIPEGFKPDVAISADIRHGDYQANSAMALAKRVKMNPRELATQVVEALEAQGVSDLASRVARSCGDRLLSSKYSKAYACRAYPLDYYW